MAVITKRALTCSRHSAASILRLSSLSKKQSDFRSFPSSAKMCCTETHSTYTVRVIRTTCNDMPCNDAFITMI